MQLSVGDTRRIIQTTALQIIEENPAGIRYTPLCREVARRLPAEVNPNSIPANIVRLVDDFPARVGKPAKGVFAPLNATAPPPATTQPAIPVPTSGQAIALQGAMSGSATVTAISVPSPAVPPVTAVQSTVLPPEEEFYEPFAEYLTGGLDECTRAIPLGGHILGRKWGTPDVVGVYRSRVTDIIKEEPLIISAEIKRDDKDLVTAFGQACSYRLFSHKVYIVLPADSDPDERGRVEALCQVFGIGLVLFDRTKPEDPDWEIRVRATRGEPDLFYVNESITPLAAKLFPP